MARIVVEYDDDFVKKFKINLIKEGKTMNEKIKELIEKEYKSMSNRIKVDCDEVRDTALLYDVAKIYYIKKNNTTIVTGRNVILDDEVYLASVIADDIENCDKLEIDFADWLINFLNNSEIASQMGLRFRR